MFLESDLFNWVILPLMIYFARIIDVSLGTMRIITLSRGMHKIAPILGFFEILIWLLAIRQIFSHLNNPACYVAYAAGFATGIFNGMWIERRLAIGYQVVRIITKYDAEKLVHALREKGFGVSALDGEGNSGPIKIIFTVVKRRDIQSVLGEVKHFNPRAFYSIEDVRAAAEGIFPNNGISNSSRFSLFTRFEKKGK
jgi:uncharacterized protein YebE (UPF0316 family)